MNYYALVHSSGLIEGVKAYYHHVGSNGWVWFYNGGTESGEPETVLNLSPGFDGYFTPLTEEEYLLGKQEAEENDN